jgi:hypothetical protein
MEPCGPVQACKGTAAPFAFFYTRQGVLRPYTVHCAVRPRCMVSRDLTVLVCMIPCDLILCTVSKHLRFIYRGCQHI